MLIHKIFSYTCKNLIEFMRKLIKVERKLLTEVYPRFGYSRHKYNVPLKLNDYRIYPKSPEHKGAFKNAIDISVPNPNDVETIVYSPTSGVIKHVEISHKVWGTTSDFKRFLNFVHIAVSPNEFIELCHLAPFTEGDKIKELKVGQKVQTGEPLAIVGLNGRITSVNGVPDSHLHIMVGEWIDPMLRKFRSLKIRWENAIQFEPLG